MNMFSLNRIDTYRSNHTSIPRRLQTTGSGDRRIQRMANRVSGRQSMRVNKRGLARAVTNASQNYSALKSALRRGGTRVKRSSFGSSGG